MKQETERQLAERLVSDYSDMILRLGYSILNSVQDAQDICQEVLLKRMAFAETFPTSAQERAWMVRVTVNACKNLRRSFWHRHTVGLDQAAEQPVFQPEPDGVLEQVQQLPVRDREVLVLYYYMGYHTEEIAGLLGVRPEAVRARMSRARRRLKAELEVQEI